MILSNLSILDPTTLELIFRGIGENSNSTDSKDLIGGNI